MIKPKATESYTGKGDFQTWWYDIEAYIKFYEANTTEVERLKFIIASLSGAARRIANGNSEARKSIQTLYEKLQSVFVGGVDWNARLHETKQLPDEEAHTFVTQFSRY